MAGHDDTAGEPRLAHLITEQDVHAYVDGELPPERRRVVEAFLAHRSMNAKQAATYLRATLGLRAVKDQIYRDEALRGEVERLLSRRAARQADDDAPARRVSA